MTIVTQQVFDKWFSAYTDPDPQLADTIQNNMFDKKTPSYKTICDDLYESNNPYSKLKNLSCSDPMTYTAHIGDKTIELLIKKLGHFPKFGIEVGSFIGSSAIIIGEYLKQNNGILLCIDTWCGDINMWTRKEFSATMNKTDANPKIFDCFIHNIINHKLTDIILPLRLSSIPAARLLKILQYTIDFVYLDSAHESGETFMELMLYHDVLKNGGVLFGDDYHMFPAIKHDVDLFCELFKYKLSFTGDYDTWMIKKII